MHDRSVLGPADVTDGQLTGMVADLLGTDPAGTTVLGSVAEVVPYELPAITTAGRYWVHGTARADGEDLPFRFFVKHVQSWSRSPLFEQVPPQMRGFAEASVPWRTEPLAYRSDLRDRLPAGLRMPRSLGVLDLDELAVVLWLEAVPTADVPWDLARYAHAAHLLGRLAASPQVRELARVGQFDWTVRTYLDGRLSAQVLPLLRDPGTWEHPLVTGVFDDGLRRGLLAAADHAPATVEELVALPTATGHGDACPNNLLTPADGDGFVLIDYGFWNLAPIGFDLSQLLVGDVNMGRRDAETLAEVEEVIVPAYVEGLRAEGCQVPEPVVRRAHALQLMLFTGLSALPFEFFGEPPSPELRAIAAQRATIARFSLDLLEATA